MELSIGLGSEKEGGGREMLRRKIRVKETKIRENIMVSLVRFIGIYGLVWLLKSVYSTSTASMFIAKYFSWLAFSRRFTAFLTDFIFFENGSCFKSSSGLADDWPLLLQSWITSSWMSHSLSGGNEPAGVLIAFAKEIFTIRYKKYS